MRQLRVGTLTMGILLVALGVLMIFARINGISAVEHIINWWPVILILLGIEILVYSFIPKREGIKIKFDGFSIFMIIAIIILSLGAYGVTNILQNISGLNIINNFSNNSRYKSQFTKNFTISAKDKDRFIIDNRFGNILLDKSTGSSIEIEVNIRIDNNDEEYAKKICDSLIDINESGPVKITSRREEYLKDKTKIQNVSISYTVKVPEGMSVEINNEFGRVNAENISGSAKIQNKHGDIIVKSVSGDLYVNDSFGRIDVEGIGGKTEVYNKNGSVLVKNAGSSVTAENSFGSLEVNFAKGDTKITNNNGKIDAKKITGKLVIDSKFCQIDVDDVKDNIDIRGNNAGMYLENIAGDVNANNKYASIDLINANKLVKLVTTNGSINFRSNKVVEKDVYIENQYGGITVSIPKVQQGNFKAGTRYGKIHSDFILDIKKESNEETINGKVGDASISFDFQNRNGDIKIIAD